MKKVILILSILILNSCAVNLSTAGKEIRIVSSDMKDCCCESLGIVSGSWGMGMSQGMDAESSYNQVRNDVAKLGGNAFWVITSSTNEYASQVQAEALKCNFSQKIRKEVETSESK